VGAHIPDFRGFDILEPPAAEAALADLDLPDRRSTPILVGIDPEHLDLDGFS
jgi:hypothetical protein